MLTDHIVMAVARELMKERERSPGRDLRDLASIEDESCRFAKVAIRAMQDAVTRRMRIAGMEASGGAISEDVAERVFQEMCEAAI